MRQHFLPRNIFHTVQLRLGKLMVFYTKIVMRLLLFLQRVTFMCNLFFLLCLVILYTHNFIQNHHVQSYIIILGFVVSFILGIIVNLWEAVLLFNRKVAVGPPWLRTFNFIILLIQICFYFYSS